MSEALIFAEHGENMLCTNIVMNVKTKQKQQFVYTTCYASILKVFMNNDQSVVILWLFDTKIRASDKDLPVQMFQKYLQIIASDILPEHIKFSSCIIFH